MAAITASDVNKLRQMTGTGMMDCKNALVEANGDFEVAIEILRKKGQKVAAKRSDRDAAEGYVIGKVAANGKAGVLLTLNCETDFVAKTEGFVKLANDIADLALNTRPSSIEALMGLAYNGATVADAITNETGKTGEKMEVSVCEVIEAGTVVAYNHPGNKTGCIVGLSQEGNFAEIGRDVAMQVAAMAPVAVDRNGVPEAVIAKELEIGKELAIQEGKPAEMAEKIAAGRLNKFFKESTLLEQEFIKDNKLSVQQYLKSASPDLTVTAFKRVSLAN